MHRLSLCILALAMVAVGQDARRFAAYEAVDPFIGTSADGNTSPAATLPFGMIQWGPDTGNDGWYHHSDRTIRGFSLTHISGAGCPIYADLPILPWAGEVAGTSLFSEGYVLPFSHNREKARPGYYGVEFDNGLSAELAVTARSGIARFAFPAGVPRTLIFKAGASATANRSNRESDTSTIEIRGADTITGVIRSGGFCDSDSNYVLYFAARFQKPFATFGAGNDTAGQGAPSASGHKAAAYVSFPAGADPIVMKVGISFVSVATAEANMNAEIAGWDFELVHTLARNAWLDMLDRVQVTGGSSDDQTVFYTGLYHMLLSPNLFSDANGEYIGFDGKVHKLAKGEAHYANFSDWDTYRNVVQFHAMLLPDETSQMMQSLVRNAEQTGWLPKWPVANDVSYVMGGDSPAILLSSAYAFGARSFDVQAALRYMLKGATQPGNGPHGKAQRPRLAEYLSRGYVPVSDVEESAASITLEYASADFAISRFAAALGDKASAERLLKSSQNWRNLFDKESGFIRPRTADGKFLAGWDPDRLLPKRKNWDQAHQMGFEEGSTWQYTWMIPHNYAGLFEAMGGAQNATVKLDKFFQKVTAWAAPTFTAANEPDFCAPFAYAWAGKPWKTQEVIDRIRTEAFSTGPDGLPGNDDLGATSGVYVWNALGVYPVIPGVGGFAIGTPLFPQSTIRMGSGNTLDIVSRGTGIYVQSVKLNGKEHNSTWIPIEALKSGQNRLEFTMGEEPNQAWASKPENYPPSFDPAAN